MQPGLAARSGRQGPSWLGRLFRLTILLLPTALLLIASARVQGPPQTTLWLGALVQGLVFAFLVVTGRGTHGAVGPAATFMYLLGLAWLWFSRALGDDWFSHLAQFLLLVVPLALFAVQTLTESGALASRHANLLAQRLANRKDWPADLGDIRSLPEVKAFREALSIEASPALALLKHPLVQVRMAALAALEFRIYWRRGQPDLVLRFGQKASEPQLRAAAVMALANIEDRVIVEQLAEFLRDPAREVRRAAVEALMWDADLRWSWIRLAVHTALAEPAQAGDGSIVTDGPLLGPDVVADLLAWAAEKGVIAVRAAQSLGAYYQRSLTTVDDPDLVTSLLQQVADPHAPPALRMELAQVLRHVHALDEPILNRLLASSNPTPLRLLACEELLKAGDNADAVLVLKDIARMPNREMALTTAEVVQRRLNVDLGLPFGQALPPVHSRLAADVMRRLMKWSQAPGPLPDSNQGDTLNPKRPGGSGSFNLPSSQR